MLQFLNYASASNLSITNNGGGNGGLGGGTYFIGSAYGGTAAFTANGNGFLDISGLTDGGMNIGSIAGSGNFFLGYATLTVGGNNLSTTVSGDIQDGGLYTMFTGGSLTKVGTGTLTLGGVDTYSGGTSVTGGTLSISGSLSGSSYVSVVGATLAGTGVIANGVTIGNGNGETDSAIIVPGAPGMIGTLTIGSPLGGSLSLRSGAEFVFNLDSTGGGAGNGASELIAAEVSLDSASQFSFDDVAMTPGTLTPGTEFTAIDSYYGLGGAFGNLPNDSEFTSGPNTFEAIYSPDELTLKVVPEPATWGLIVWALGIFVAARRLRSNRRDFDLPPRV